MAIAVAPKNNMRVIAGKYKNHRIEAPIGLETRPTMDRVKEAMFSILSHELIGAHCLDLFAGSGALGIEAFSRGAEYVLCNDISRVATQKIQQNLSHLKINSGIDIWTLPYEKALKRLIETQLTFDLILLDPPYKMEGISALISLIIENGLLRPRGSILLESSMPTVIDSIDDFHVKEYHYGDKKLTWLKHNQNP